MLGVGQKLPEFKITGVKPGFNNHEENGVSAFEALFSGRRGLFAGLYAEEVFSRPDYRTYPVLRFDMSMVTANKDIDTLESSILRQVRNNDRIIDREEMRFHPVNAIQPQVFPNQAVRARINEILNDVDFFDVR